MAKNDSLNTAFRKYGVRKQLLGGVVPASGLKSYADEELLKRIGTHPYIGDYTGIFDNAWEWRNIPAQLEQIGSLEEQKEFIQSYVRTWIAENLPSSVAEQVRGAPFEANITLPGFTQT